MNEVAARELADRIRAQGWRQGSKLPQRHDLFLANPRVPLTPEAIDWAARQSEDALSGVVHAEHPDDPPMIITSQTCDLLAHPSIEPLVEAIPVVELPENANLPQRNSARYFTIDPERGLVADLTRKLAFEKGLLPNTEAEHYLEPGDLAEAFRAWCGRRYTRVPLADDFNLVVGSALTWAWGKKGRSRDSRTRSMLSWRVILSEEGEGIDVAFIIPFDERMAESDSVQSLVDELIADTIRRLPKSHEAAVGRFGDAIEIREFRIVGAKAQPSDLVSLRALLDFPPLALEHFTFRGEETFGAAPRSEDTP